MTGCRPIFVSGSHPPLFLDMQGGIVERFRSMPIARSGVLWAHVLTSVVADLASVALVLGWR